ncbi:MAG: helix-turn-helix domain-containing protein [Lautropia sp.]
MTVHLINALEAAARLGISKRMLYELAAPNGPLPCVRIGRAVRFDPRDIEEFVGKRRSEPAAPAAAVRRVRPAYRAGGIDLEAAFRAAGVKLEAGALAARRRLG